MLKSYCTEIYCSLSSRTGNGGHTAQDIADWTPWGYSKMAQQHRHNPAHISCMLISTIHVYDLAIIVPGGSSPGNSDNGHPI